MLPLSHTNKKKPHLVRSFIWLETASGGVNNTRPTCEYIIHIHNTRENMCVCVFPFRKTHREQIPYIERFANARKKNVRFDLIKLCLFVFYKFLNSEPFIVWCISPVCVCVCLYQLFVDGVFSCSSFVRVNSLIRLLDKWHFSVCYKKLFFYFALSRWNSLRFCFDTVTHLEATRLYKMLRERERKWATKYLEGIQKTLWYVLLDNS